MKRWLTARAVLVLGIVCLILGTVVALRDIHRFRENEYATFSRQSAEFASIFVKSASTWLARENASALDAVRFGCFLPGAGNTCASPSETTLFWTSVPTMQVSLTLTSV